MKTGIVIFFFLFTVACAQPSSSSLTFSPNMAKKVVYLNGKTEKQIKRVMGNPILTRREEPNEFWVYRNNECSTLIYFDEKKTSAYAEMRGKCQRVLTKLM